MKMDIAVCVICLLCCLGYGHSLPNDADNVSLVLSNTTCENNNEYGVPFKFETVSYDEVRDLENQVLKLLNERDSVRLADYGVIRHNSLKCLKLIETTENNKRVSEIKNSIKLASDGPKLAWENVLKNKSAFIGYLPSMCVYVPLRASDISYLKEVEDSQCSKDRSTNITLQSSEIYLYLIASNFGHDITSFHMLCSYFVQAKPDDGNVEVRFSHCGLPNDGAICEICNERFSLMLKWIGPYGRSFNVCRLQKRSGCWYQVCADKYKSIEEYFPKDSLSVLGSNVVYYTDREKIVLLDVYKKPYINTKCISLTRVLNRLFVNTTTCDTPMNFICKITPYNHVVPETTIKTIIENNTTGPRAPYNHAVPGTLSIALISVGVSFVIILATVIVIVVSRRNIQRDRDTSTSGTQLAVSAVMGHLPDAGSVSGHAPSVDDDSNAGSVSGHAPSVDNDSYAGSVPGRGGTVDNDSYVRSVPGRAGAVDSDSFGGEVHGRTASGRINLY